MRRRSVTNPQGAVADQTKPTGQEHRLDERALGALPAWKLEDAKARFSEVVRRAHTEGPQRVTRRGRDAVVVIAVDDLERLPPEPAARPNLVEFLQGTALGELDLTRAEDRGRDPPV
jgi:prevent-host-death family protein